MMLLVSTEHEILENTRFTVVCVQTSACSLIVRMQNLRATTCGGMTRLAECGTFVYRVFALCTAKPVFCRLGTGKSYKLSHAVFDKSRNSRELSRKLSRVIHGKVS